MGLLEKLKSALGLDGARSSEASASGDVDVTVEREPSTEAEDAVKGTETTPTDAETEDGPAVEEADPEPETDEVDAESEPVPEAEDTAGESAAAVEEAADDDAEEVADDAEAAAEPDAAEGESPEDEETDSDTEEADTTEEEADTPEGSSDPVTELNGIGPAYAERLHGLDIETIGELAAADAAEIAAQTDLGEKRVADWIEQAKDY